MISGSEWGGHRLQSFEDCHRKYFWEYQYAGNGLVLPTKGGALFRGTVIHYALQHFYTNAKPELSYVERVVLAMKEACALMDTDASLPEEERSLIIRCLSEYFKFYESDTLTPLHAELPFTLSVGPYEHTGIIDLLGEYAGYTVVVDHKTTTDDWANFFRRWKRDRSLQGYMCWARQHFQKPVQLLINGIRFTKHKVPQIEFRRETFFFLDEDMREWEREVKQIRWDIMLRDKHRKEEWEKNGGHCNVNHRECSFARLCDNYSQQMVHTFYQPRPRTSAKEEVSNEGHVVSEVSCSEGRADYAV